MKLQALIWDVDGTLAETEDEGHRPAFNFAFAEAGLDWYWDSELYGELLRVTGGKERIHAWWRQVDPRTAAAPETPQRVRRLHERKTAHYLDRLARGAVQLRPGVASLLAAGRQRGLKQAIATATSADNVAPLLEHGLGAQARGLFDVIGAGDIVTAKKPAPDIYEWVLRRLNLPPQACLAIEDSAAGVQAAQRAGIPVLLVRGRFSGAAVLPGCVADLHSLVGVSLETVTGWHAAAAV